MTDPKAIAAERALWELRAHFWRLVAIAIPAFGGGISFGFALALAFQGNAWATLLEADLTAAQAILLTLAVRRELENQP